MASDEQEAYRVLAKDYDLLRQAAQAVVLEWEYTSDVGLNILRLKRLLNGAGK